MNWKGFIANKKKGSLATITEADIFVTEKPQKPHVETDPTVPQHVKDITEGDILEWVTGFNNNVISGSVTGNENKILTLTKRNGSTLSIPFTDISGELGDDVINTLSFNSSTGVLTAVTSEGVSITTNLDGRYALLNHNHNGVYAPINHTHNYENPLSFNNGNLIELVRTNNSIKANKLVKPVVNFNINISLGLSPDSIYNNKWINIIGDNPILIISNNLLVPFGEIEGSFIGTGKLTISAGTGVTLIWPEEYFTNTYPEGAVFGVKFLTSTTAMLFGKQIPIGL